MNPNLGNPVLITEEDYELLKTFINNSKKDNDEMTLSSELKRAIVVNKDAFPPHAVRINSKISVMDLSTEKVVDFTLVMPMHANIHTNKVSILSPMGAALIGFRKGEEVQWRVPGGLKKFRILEVENEL